MSTKHLGKKYSNEAAQATIRLSPRNRYLKVWLLREFRGVEVGGRQNFS
jgi:hypothetical protein